MVYVHPALMVVVIGLALYVLRLGAIRFATTRLGSRTGAFPWKRHVFLGKLAMAGLFAGMLGGLTFTWLFWKSPGATGLHSRVAMVMAGLIVWGALTGLSLDKTRRPGNPLALAHGLGNALLVLLALFQIYTGYGVLRDFVW